MTTTRKLFRMAYEPCNGGCYEYDDVLKIHGLGLDVEAASTLLRRITEIHNFACGNAEIAYGLDFDESGGTFIASFRHYGVLDLGTSPTALGALDWLIESALTWQKSPEGSRLLQDRPGLGHDVCVHGKDQDLRKFALQFSGLDPQAQSQIMGQFA